MGGGKNIFHDLVVHHKNKKVIRILIICKIVVSNHVFFNIFFYTLSLGKVEKPAETKLHFQLICKQLIKH